MNDPNAWKRGMQRLSPGVYRDAQGTTHIDSAELLVNYGIQPTLQNEAMLAGIARAVLGDQGVKFRDVEERTK